MSKNRTWAVLILMAFAAPIASLQAEVIDVPNGTFDLPVIRSAPFATPNIASWQKAPVPAWWLGAGYTADDWSNTTGVFYNIPGLTPDTQIYNMGEQGAFLFATPGVELYQDLAAMFEPGKSYHLTVGLLGGGYAMPAGSPMALVLYYRDGTGARVPVGSLTVPYDPPPSRNYLVDHTLDLPAVQAGDPWSGKNIGVQFVSTVDMTGAGGYWDLGNVRLVAAPEPATLAILACGLAGLMLRRRRR